MSTEQRRIERPARLGPGAARALARLRKAIRAREGPIVIGLGAVLLVLIAQLREPAVPWLTWDARVYWEASLTTDLYAEARVGALGAYLYSPAFAQLLAPAGLLPWFVFVFGWAALSIAVAVALVRDAVARHRWLWLPLATLAILDIGAGNVNVILAGAIVVGFRWPGAWALVVLTKVTPGLGVVWFAVRREWRNFTVAVGVTLLVIGLSAAFELTAWSEWVTMLAGNATPVQLHGDIALPAHVRFPVALLLIAWGAWTDRRWVVPLACVLLLPVIWPNALALLLGSAALHGGPAAQPTEAEGGAA